MAAAATGQALLVGAGTSAGPPSGLPLGAAFDDLLLACFVAAARRVASDLVDPSGIGAVQRRRHNLLRPLAVRAGRDMMVDLLECFRVVVPTEAQMLTAALAARGVLILTLNINDGIERAYALLAGDADLPPRVPAVSHTALDTWRRRLEVAGPLHVVGSGFVVAGYDRRPLLVRLRGSSEEGWHESLVPPLVGPTVLGDDLLVALRAAIDGRHLAIAGVSGADRDCRASLPPLLRRGRFSWTCAELDAELVATLRRIDPRQPTLRPAVEGVRALVPAAAELPAWPQEDPGVPGFAAAFERWRARLPLHAAAATYADLLMDSDRVDTATALLSRLVELQRRGR